MKIESINPKHKMLLSIVIDNSASMKNNKMDLIKSALSNFDKKINENGINEYLKYQVVTFESLHAKDFKKFESRLEVDALRALGIPLFNKAILRANENLQEEIKNVTSNNFEIYKPWLIVLFDGINFGQVSESTKLISHAISNNKLTYFPFMLSNNDIDESLKELVDLKRPLIISQFKYENLFDWIIKTLTQRIMTPFDQPAKLDFMDFDGWIQK